MHAAAGTTQLTSSAVNAVGPPGDRRAKLRWHRALLLGGVIATAQAAASDLDLRKHRTELFADADLSSTVQEPDSTDNSVAEFTKARLARVDLQLTKTASSAGVAAGAMFTYQIDVLNAGPEAEPGPLVVTDPLPEGLTLQASSSGAGWECLEPRPREVVCQHVDALPAGLSASPIILWVTAPDEVQELVNTAQVRGAGDDLDAANNEGFATTSIFDPSLPDLAIGINDTPDPVASGQSVHLTVHIRNQGGGTAPGPNSFTIDLPPQLEYLGGGSPSWSCSAVAQQVTCDSDEEIGPGVSLPGISIMGRTSGPVTTVVARARLDYEADPNVSNNEASTSITIAGPVPVSARDRYSVQSGQTLTVARPGVLGNDVSGPESTLAVDMFFDPDRGALQLHPDGSFSYVPAAAFIGTDTFFYRATDGTSQSGLTAVDVEVVAAGTGAAPLANDDHYDAIAGRALDVAGPGVLANDTDAENDVLLAALVLAPAHGDIELGSNGGLHYLPDDGFVGEDSFTYTASDGAVLSSAATVTLTVSASGSGGTAPTAFDDQFALPPDQTLAVSAPGVLTNDADADDDLLSVRLVAAPEHGVLGIGSDGSFTYQPDPGFLGSDRFQYVASDGVLESAVATANIAVANIDLAVAKSNGVDGLGDGQSVVYVVEVRNEGASPAIGARVADLLPLQLVDAQWTCTAIGTDCPQSAGTGSPEIVADFPPGSQLILQISARVDAGSATSVINTATVVLAANEVDAVPDNNQATDVDAMLPDGVLRDGFESLGLKRFEETLPAYRKRARP